MLGETGYQESVGSSLDAQSDATSQTEIAAYVGSLGAELQTMAKASGLPFLSYLLSMVVMHAQEIVAASDANARKRA